MLILLGMIGLQTLRAESETYARSLEAELRKVQNAYTALLQNGDAHRQPGEPSARGGWKRWLTRFVRSRRWR